MISHQWNTAYDRIDEKHNMHTLIKDQRKGGLKKKKKSAEILTSTVISITHCGTVSLSSMDSVSPPESLHSNLQRKNKADQKKRWTCATISNDVMTSQGEDLTF